MDKANVWKEVLDNIKLQISSANFRTWFSQTQLGTIDESQLTILVPSAFIKGQLINRYEKLLQKALEETLKKDLEIEIIVDPSQFPKKASVSKEASEEAIFEEEAEDTFQLEQYVPQAQTNLNPKYTLESFVVGLTNNLAFAAAQAVSQNPGISYNPLFIYGPSGVGKTHLMQGIGNALLKKNSRLKLIYVSSERFMNDLVESIQTKKTGSFRQKYRHCDAFLIDDIQFISGKDSTQEEFFHTFNELQGKNAQIVMTSDRPPNDIQKLEARLASRFQGGLMVDIQLPDFDTRMAILKAKLQERGDTLPEDVLVMIAHSVESNTRELEGKLIQILQLAKLSGQEVTMELLTRYLGKPPENNTPQSRRMNQQQVLSEVNQYFNIKLEDLVGPRRQKELVLPRQIAMYILYEDCKLPYEKIGELLGGRDHTTIMHGVDKIKVAQSRDREVQRYLIEIKQHLS